MEGNIQETKPQSQEEVYGYSRESKEEQTKGSSLDDQHKRIEEYCIKHNLKLVGIINEVHSSKEGKLKLLKETLHKIVSEPTLSGLVVAYTSRLGRDDVLPRIVARDLRLVGKKLHCCDIDADIGTPAGYTLFSILVMMANIENLNKGQLVKNVLETIRTKEKRITFKPWLGYKFDETKHLIVDPYNSLIVKQVFTQTAKNVSPTKLCNETIIEKAKYVDNKRTVIKIPLTQSSFYKIIHNPIYYMGSYSFKGQLIEFTSLITKEIYDKTQIVLKKRRKNA